MINSSATHLFVPVIEDSFRNVLRLCNGVIWKKSKDGSGFDYKNLDEILRDENLMSIFSEKLMRYFRVVLTDRKGLNIRNNVAHGLIPQERLTFLISDRLIHILLCLAAVRFDGRKK